MADSLIPILLSPLISIVIVITCLIFLFTNSGDIRERLVEIGPYLYTYILLLLFSPVMLSGLVLYSFYLFMAVGIKFLIVRHSLKAAKDEIDTLFTPFLDYPRLKECLFPLSAEDMKYIESEGLNIKLIELLIFMNEVIYRNRFMLKIEITLPDTSDAIIREEFLQAMKNNSTGCSIAGDQLLSGVAIKLFDDRGININLSDRELLSVLKVFFKIVLDPNFDYDAELMIDPYTRANQEQKLQFITFIQAQCTYFEGLVPENVLPANVQEEHLFPLLGMSFFSHSSSTSCTFRQRKTSSPENFSVDAIPSTAEGFDNLVTSIPESSVHEESQQHLTPSFVSGDPSGAPQNCNVRASRLLRPA